MLVLALGTLGLVGCEATRHLQPGELLVRKSPRLVGARSLSDETLLSGVRTKPNRKTLFVKLPLHLHSLGTTIARDSSPAKKLYRKLDKKGYYENELVTWLVTRVGEAPQLVNTKTLADDASNLESIYFGEGFLQARVIPRVKPRGRASRKADVSFLIDEGPPYLLIRRTTVSDNPEVSAIVTRLHTYTQLTIGSRYSEQRLAEERIRIAESLRNAGYFRFGPEQVSYVVDTLSGEVPADLPLLDRQAVDSVLKTLPRGGHPPRWMQLEVVLPPDLQKCSVEEIHVSVRGSGQTSVSGETSFRLNRLTPELRRAYHIRDRWLQPDYDMVFSTYPNLARETDMSVIARRIRLRTGQDYSLIETRRTQAQLQALGLFRNSILTYEGIDSARSPRLRANLDLSLLRRWGISVGTETFQSEDFRLRSNLPGVGLAFTLSNRNLFGRAEHLDLTANGNASFFQPGLGGPVQTFYQLTLRASFSLPTFWLFESPRRNLLDFRPTTGFILTFNTEQRPQFDRTTLGFDWQYQWYNIPFSPRAMMTLSPISITYVETLKKPDFESLLIEVNPSVREFILRDFRPRFFAKTTYYYTYSGFYGQRRDRNTWFVRAGVEYGGGGNLNDSTTGGKFVFGQFTRFSAEVKYFIPLTRTSEFVARAFVGVARPLFARRIIPYENRYFTGGTNSVRGWLSSTLGPGTYRSDTIAINNLIAPGGEYAIELNAEYRYRIIGPLYGAVFLDAGNVWFSPGSEFGDPRSYLTADNLELGVAGGLGLRLDLTYFVFRLDFGQQLYAPDIRRWVVRNFPRDIGGSRMVWNIGLGFPF